jgi:hypothetical protein
MDQISLIEAMFIGMRESKALIPDKDTANKMEEDFKKTSVEGFFQEMAQEIENFETEDHQEALQFFSGVGVLTREFVDYKIKNAKK